MTSTVTPPPSSADEPVLEQQALDVSIGEIARAVVIFLGIPLVAGFVTRQLGERRRGFEWYEERFLPQIGPVALWGLLFTIVVLFALQGGAITSAPLDVARIAVPLLAYFGLMWGVSFALGLRVGLPYDRNTTVAFTAAVHVASWARRRFYPHTRAPRPTRVDR